MQGDSTHRETLELSTAEITRRLINVIGRKLTAYIGNVDDVRAVESWAAGGEMSDDASIRLRFSFRLVQTLLEAQSPAIIQAWLMGVNPDLDDRVPIRLMRQSNLETVAPDILRAAHTFLVEG
jgi:hypothetical protein